MRTRTTNRLRPTLDALEARDVPATLVEVNTVISVVAVAPNSAPVGPTILGAGRLGPYFTAASPAPASPTAETR